MPDLPIVFDLPVTLVGGAPFEPEALAEALAIAPRLIAADRAGDALTRLGHAPELLVGDMDSVADLAAWHAGPTRVLHLPEQDTTDFEKALYATEAPFYLALGFTGRRLDHTLAVLHTMLSRPDRRVVLLAEAEVIALVPPGRRLRLALGAGARVSLVPLAPVVATHSAGLKWPIDGLRMGMGEQIGTSNRAVADEVELAFDAPGVLVLLHRSQLGALLDGLAPEASGD